MPICNRDKDVSEQREVVKINVGALATGKTRECFILPWPARIEAAYAYAQGLSGAPKIAVQFSRFIVGSGATAILGATAQTIAAFSTSGLAGVSYIGGVSVGYYDLQAKDCIEVVSSASNAAFADLCVEFQLKKTQDTLSFF
jgi:hypothetical protein